MKSNIFNKTMVPGQETHFAFLSTWSGWNREMYVPARSLVGSGWNTHPHVPDWNRRQSKELLNNAENWMSMLVLSAYLCACVVECMGMHGRRNSTENPADVELYYCWAHIMDVKDTNPQ